MMSKDLFIVKMHLRVLSNVCQQMYLFMRAAIAVTLPLTWRSLSGHAVSSLECVLMHIACV